MERRALLAVIISLLILVVYQEVVIKRVYGPPPGGAPGEPPPQPPPPVREPAPELEAAPPSHPAPAVEGRDVVLETDLYRAVFTTAGARLKSFELKQYRTTVDPRSPPLQLIVQVVPSDLPLGLELRGAENVNDAGVAYGADRDRVELAHGESGAITFTGELNGATLTKRVQAWGNRYVLGVDVRVAGASRTYSEIAVAWHKGLDGARPHNAEVIFDSIVALQGRKLRHEDFAGLEEGKYLTQEIGWVAYSGRYFLAAMVPSEEPDSAVRLWLKRRGRTVETQVLMPPGQFEARLEVYVGPKEIEALEDAGHSLGRAVDLGWFTFVALPLLQVLKLSHRLTGNYGIDIVLLTVLIKILFIPLTHRSLKSMQEMQKLQPQMAKIRERLKDKPDEMNKEVMELYRRHKVNPLGGCLPMVLQIPVFIGLYQALLSAIELRHAPFAGWIKDLSAPDRLGSLPLPFVEPPGVPVLTLLMGASMFVQQWMTPSAADPTQQRIMLIMPVLFTFMFINFPAGLTLYWLVNNILTIAQQYAMNRPGR